MIHTKIDCLQVDAQISHHPLCAVVLQHHSALQALEVHVVEVVEEHVVVLFVTQVPDSVENTQFAQVLRNEHVVSDVRIEILYVGAGRREAEVAVRDAVGFFYFLGAQVALEGQDARDEDSPVAQCVLVLVHLQDQIRVQIHDASVEERIADGLRVHFGDVDVCLQDYLRIKVVFPADEVDQLLAICLLNQESWD